MPPGNHTTPLLPANFFPHFPASYFTTSAFRSSLPPQASSRSLSLSVDGFLSEFVVNIDAISREIARTPPAPPPIYPSLNPHSGFLLAIRDESSMLHQNPALCSFIRSHPLSLLKDTTGAQKPSLSRLQAGFVLFCVFSFFLSLLDPSHLNTNKVGFISPQVFSSSLFKTNKLIITVCAHSCRDHSSVPVWR